MPTFFTELKRRRVFRVAAAYAIVGWLLIQIATQVFPFFELPNWSVRLIVLLILAGFPIALVLAWAFDVTPEGIVRTDESGQPVLRRARSGTLTAAALGVVIALVAGAGYWMWHRPNSEPAPGATSSPGLTKTPAATSTVAPTAVTQDSTGSSIPAKSIAVLPFENLSSDKDNAYFSDGMQDLILTKLADIGELKVISRTSTRKYASRPDDLKTIAQQLGVATILEGSVQKSGNQVMINVQLIDAKTDAHLWAQSYQRTLDNVFGVEGEVAGQIATALKAKLSPAETQNLATALSADPAANDLFLRAEYIANQSRMNVDIPLLKQAIPLYRQAIAKAPDFALARARLSHAQSLLAFNFVGGEDIQQLTKDARTQAEQALTLAPDLVEAQLALGYCDYYGRRDYAGALTTFDAVLKARPNDVEGLTAKGLVLRRQGRFEDAIASLQQALEHDPRNSALADDLGTTYAMVSRYTEAKAAFQHALALDPLNITAKNQYAQAILYANGDVAGALAAAQGDSPSLQFLRVNLLTYQRKYEDALTLLASIPDTLDNFGSNGGRALRQAYLYGLLGDTARARALYAQALPLVRAQLMAHAGSDIYASYTWRLVADAELGLGNTAASLAAIGQAQALMTRVNDHLMSVEATEGFAFLYAKAGRPDLAVPLLERALATPGIGANYSPVMLWIDPDLDPIRSDPGFQALLKKYASAKPAVASGEVKP